MRDERVGAGGHGMTALNSGDTRDLAFTSPAGLGQERLWFVDQMSPGTAMYNLAGAVDLTGPLNITHLERAVNECAQRHESIRTCFSDRNGDLEQVVMAEAAIRLLVIDLGEMPAASGQAAVEELAATEAALPFDLRRAPLLRLRLIRLDNEHHVLLITFHHMIADGWSLGVFVQEVGAIYQALHENRSPELPPLPVQYADYANWQRVQLGNGALEEHLAYWRQRLADLKQTDLARYRTRPPTESHRGATSEFVIEPGLAERLRQLSRDEHVTLFATLLAGYNVLLARHTGQGDVVVGGVAANRSRPETRNMIGFLANTLVLRTRFADGASLRDVLRLTAEVCCEAYVHQDAPFTSVVESLGGLRDASRHPLCQVFFQLVAAPVELDLTGVRIRPRHVGGTAAKYDLLFTVVEAASGGLTGEVEYATDLFSPAEIADLVERWLVILEALAGSPDMPFDDVPLLRPAEHQLVVEEWNGTERPYPREATIDRLFAEQVARTPGAIALADGTGAWTYSWLERRANQIAHALREKGVGPDIPVAIHMRRSVGLVVAALAALKAGGCYLVLDVDDPWERSTFVVEDAKAGVVLTQDDDLTRLGLEIPVVDIRDTVELPTDPPPHTAGAANLANIVYTSGSTGVPKGVGVAHQAISRLVRDSDYVTVRPDDVVGHFAHPAFDATTFEIWAPLVNGGRVRVFTSDDVLGPAELAEAIDAAAVDVLFLTTALLNEIVDVRPAAFRGLRHLLFGGEKVDPRRVARILEYGAPENLVHVYGPTESTTFASWHLVRNVASDAVNVPIGRPVANTRLYVVDRWSHPVPPGMPGELLIGGDGLARGYLGRARLTAERFVPDQFSGLAGGRLYRTGDVVRWTPGGELEFLGRDDQQVKIRGHRIEPGEIETVLSTHPNVLGCAVLATEHRGERRLVAYVRTADRTDVTAGALRQFLRERIPHFMVPGQFELLTTFPLTVNGKVDRSALPRLAAHTVSESHSQTGELSAVERELAEIWTGLLDVRPIGRDDDFFLIGGHSLLATRLVTVLADRFAVEVPLRLLFEHSTLSALAEQIDHLRLSGAERDDLAGLVAQVESLCLDEDGEARHD